jgi:hypothetical protein
MYVSRYISPLAFIDLALGQWDVLFNLPIPGWLPASTTMGMDEIGISYGLYATAKFINLDIEHGPSPWSFATFCTPFRSRVRSTYASKAISLRRYVLPPHVDQSTSSINYLVNSHLSAEKPDSSKKRIPTEVLSKIQVLASIPEFVDVKGSSIPITVRLRTKGLESNECKRLQVTEIGINIIQQERCRYVLTRLLPAMADRPLAVDIDPLPRSYRAIPFRLASSSHRICHFETLILSAVFLTSVSALEGNTLSPSAAPFLYYLRRSRASTNSRTRTMRLPTTQTMLKIRLGTLWRPASHMPK